jgi:anti-sigma B factor antagonist
MNLSTRDLNGITVVELEGSVLGGPDATELNDLLHALAEKKKKRVILDLGSVHTMNSSGLSMLIAALTTLKNAGGTLRVAGASEKIENLFVITKLSTVFEMYPTVKKAAASFSK